jgi:hypothetical protein
MPVRATGIPLVQHMVCGHTQTMAGRPCKPDADLKWIWQTLLRGTPLPVCGVTEDSHAAALETVRPATESSKNQEPSVKARRD